MFATQVLPETCCEDNSKNETSSESVGLIIVENEEHEIRKGENKIGRDHKICSIVIENSTVSKLHAVIESEGVDDTFIYDVGSTNQTKLGKKNLKPHYRYKLDNGTLLTFGNVVAKYVTPSVIEDGSKSTGIPAPDLGRNGSRPDVLNKLGDIFDVATQVDSPQPRTSEVMTKFERLPDNFHIFKVPSPLVQGKEKNNSPGTTESYLETTTQGQINPKKSPKPFIGEEDPNIFSLTTQCQLPELLDLSKTNEKSENEDGDVEKLQFLLNDREDDALCCLMAAYSPGGKFQEKKVRIKTEVSETNSDAIFDFPTQLPFISEPKELTDKNREIKQEVLSNEKLGEDFHCVIKQELSQSPAHICSDTNSAVERDVGQINLQAEEKTGDEKNADEGNLSQNSRESYLEISIEDNEVQIDEDFILTQKFESLRKNEELHVKEEDFEETQVYDVKNIRCPEICEKIPKISSLVVVESSDDENGSDLEESLQSATQKSKNEDFISTQIYGSQQSGNKEGSDIKTARVTQSSPIPKSDGEDFIASQTREEPAPQEMDNRRSRESSPDLLSGCPQNYAEDFICTQTFNMEKHTPEIKPLIKESVLLRRFGVSGNHDREPSVGRKNQNQVPPSISSGGDTESDLEIILSDSDVELPKNISHLVNVKKELRDEVLREDNLVLGDDGDSNSSYVFQLEETQVETTKKVVDVADSDETDCEEICAINIAANLMPCKKELSEQHDEICPGKSETANEDRLSGEESPKFEVEAANSSEEESNHSWLSLKMPATQDLKTTLGKMLKRGNEKPDKGSLSKIQKTEVRIKSSNCLESGKADFSDGTKLVDSPSKRIRNEDNFPETVPSKKSRNAQNAETSNCGTERRFSKLRQAHDLSHIQATRTRNSTKNLELAKTGNSTEGNFNKKRQSCRRKSNSGNGVRARREKSEAASRKSEGRKSVRGGREKDLLPSPEDFLMKPKSPDIKSVSRILRSATRRNSNLVPCNLFESSLGSNSIRKGLRRNSRTKNEGSYFGDSCVNVVFTGFECEHLEKIISDLGGKKSQDMSCSQVVVADKVRRTVKFLCAVGLGLPVASPKWLLSCREENKFLNPWDYILKDEDSEEKWDFDLRSSLERSKKAKLLRGFNVYATESTKPPVRDLLSIVECCGGVPLFERPDIWPKKTVIVSCLEDKDSWPPPKLRQVKIVHYEFILSGALTQKIDFKTYSLR